MKKTKSTPANENEAVLAEQPREPNHKELIKSQVLAKIGKPPSGTGSRFPSITAASTASTFGSSLSWTSISP